MLLCLQGCSCKGDKQLIEAEQTIPIAFNPETSPPLDSFISKITVIPLETNDKCLLRETFMGVKGHQGLIYINNEFQDLFVFDLNGKFIRKIGNKGQGPGEFLEVRDFIFTPEGTIEILDFKKIESYTLEGKHLGTIKRFDFLGTDFYINPMNFCKSPSSKYYFWGGMQYGNNTHFNRTGNLMYRLNSDMQIEAGFFEKNFGDGGTRDRFTYYKDKILIVSSPADNHIYQINPNDSVTMRYIFDFGKYSVKAGKDDDRTTIAIDNYVNSIKNYYETDHFMFFNFSFTSQRLIYYLLYFKATGQFYIKSLKSSADEKDIGIYPIQTIINDNLVALVQPTWLKMTLERMSPANIKKWGLGKYQKLNDDDNPVLILYKPKF